MDRAAMEMCMLAQSNYDYKTLSGAERQPRRRPNSAQGEKIGNIFLIAKVVSERCLETYLFCRLLRDDWILDFANLLAAIFLLDETRRVDGRNMTVRGDVRLREISSIELWKGDAF